MQPKSLDIEWFFLSLRSTDVLRIIRFIDYLIFVYFSGSSD